VYAALLILVYDELTCIDSLPAQIDRIPEAACIKEALMDLNLTTTMWTAETKTLPLLAPPQTYALAGFGRRVNGVPSSRPLSPRFIASFRTRLRSRPCGGEGRLSFSYDAELSLFVYRRDRRAEPHLHQVRSPVWSRRACLVCWQRLCPQINCM
jgi:hypothetical protein